jgi:rhamnosyltransferase
MTGGSIGMKIIAVIVTYYPDRFELCALLNSLTRQTYACAVVDNGTESGVKECVEDYCKNACNSHFIGLQDNLGVAAAQNIGIEWAKDQGADYIIMFDQDSMPAPDMISRLIRAHRLLREKGFRVGAVGPVVRDVRTGTFFPFRRLGWFRTRRISASAEPLISADFLISSGMLCSTETLQAVGCMREELFIDHVDTDWFLRAKAAGYNAWGVRDAILHHALGEATLSFDIPKDRLIYLHKAFRYYYIFRNSITMYSKEYATTKWISGDIVRLFILSLSILFNTNKYECYKMIATGIIHGLKGKTGRYYADIT